MEKRNFTHFTFIRRLVVVGMVVNRLSPTNFQGFLSIYLSICRACKYSERPLYFAKNTMQTHSTLDVKVNQPEKEMFIVYLLWKTMIGVSCIQFLAGLQNWIGFIFHLKMSWELPPTTVRLCDRYKWSNRKVFIRGKSLLRCQIGFCRE